MKIRGNKKCQFYWQCKNGVMLGSGITLNQILENYIDKLSKRDDIIGKMSIENFIINNKVYNIDSEVYMTLKIVPIEYPCNADVHQSWYKSTKCTIKELLNKIGEIADEYTCSLETYMDNIKITVKQFEIK